MCIIIKQHINIEVTFFYFLFINVMNYKCRFMIYIQLVIRAANFWFSGWHHIATILIAWCRR